MDNKKYNSYRISGETREIGHIDTSGRFVGISLDGKLVHTTGQSPKPHLFKRLWARLAKFLGAV